MRSSLCTKEGGVLNEGPVLTPRERLLLWLRMALRLFPLLLFWLLRRQLGVLLSLLLPFLLAWGAAALLEKPIRLLRKKSGLSRRTSALIVVLLFFALLGSGLFALCYYSFRELGQLSSGWPELIASLSAPIAEMSRQLERFSAAMPRHLGGWIDNAQSQLSAFLSQCIPKLFSAVSSWAGNLMLHLPGAAVGVTAFLLATYFLAAGYPGYRRAAAGKLSPGGKLLAASVQAAARAAFGGYLRAQLLLSAGVFTILLAGFLLLRQPYALLLSFLLAVLDFIPIVGSGTVIVPWAVVLFLLGGRSRAMLLLALWGVIALFRQIAEPKVLGGQMGLSPLAALVAVYAGMRLWGVGGMILAPILLLMGRSLVSCGALDGLLRDWKAIRADLGRLWRDSFTKDS